MDEEVIEILSDQQEKSKKVQMTNMLEQKLIQKQAIMGSDLDVVIASIKRRMTGSDKQKSNIIHKRIKKMFNWQADLQKQDKYCCNRRQPDYADPSTHPVFNKIIIYGADLWPVRKIEKSIKAFFEQKQGQKQQCQNQGSQQKLYEVIKLDGSHKMIIFKDEKDAKKWLLRYAEHYQNAKIKLQEDDESQMTGQSQNDKHDKQKMWIKLQSYKFMSGIIRNRQVRFATSLQDKMSIEQLKSKSVNSNIEEISKQIRNKLLIQFEAENDFALLMLEKKQYETNRNKYRYGKHKKPYRGESSYYGSGYGDDSRTYSRYNKYDSSKYSRRDKWQDRRSRDFQRSRTKRSNQAEMSYRDSRDYILPRNRYQNNEIFLNRTQVLHIPNSQKDNNISSSQVVSENSSNMSFLLTNRQQKQPDMSIIMDFQKKMNLNQKPSETSFVSVNQSGKDQQKNQKDKSLEQLLDNQPQEHIEQQKEKDNYNKMDTSFVSTKSKISKGRNGGFSYQKYLESTQKDGEKLCRLD